MILMRILPGVLKELSKHVPTVLFQTVEWSDLAHELPKISRRMIQKEGYEELFTHHLRYLGRFDIELTKEQLHPIPLRGNKWAGEQILVLYFAQLYSQAGLFLDLRSHHFEITSQQFKWHPSAFWTQLGEDFRLGLLKVYEGFYERDDSVYFEGLTSIGLIRPDWTLEEKQKLGDLFKNHFGSSLKDDQSFNLDHLQESIVKMSEFMLKKKVKIPKDFLYLGIYLVGLYSVLEETGEKLPVRELFLKVKNQATSEVNH